MQIRNPIYTADGRIDCEIEHPAHGWVPFTAAADDGEAHGREIFAAALGVGPAPYVPPAISIDVVRKQAVAAINQHAGYVRTLFATDAPLQALVYAEKQREGERYLAASPEPADLAGYPWIAAEVGATAPTARDLAMLWLSMANMWVAVGSNIEGIRMSHITMLGHPELTVEAAASIRDGAIAALDEIALLAP